ncbi:MAG: F0F1 ATP synthase subunit A, partial [Ignavibacteriae bacterium]|nr:F0F1 ATP synthase subunit A [Ignavibacteriota bacterium]
MYTEEIKVVSDSLNAAPAEAKGDGAGWIMHHILDSRVLDFEPFFSIHLPELHLFGLDISITKHVVFMWIAFALMIIIFNLVAKSYKKSFLPKGLSNVMEMLIVFVK